MTYGRVHFANHEQMPDGAVVSHSAELVRGDSSLGVGEGLLIRPSGTFSPRGEGPSWHALEHQ
jgi:hypothetical protein